jgi:FkbM family methyltransferase
MIDSFVPRSGAFVGKVLRLPLRLLPSGMTVPILQGPLRGKKWILGSQRHAFWLGSYERHLQKLIARELKKGSTFYDIGANVGFYSLLASFLVAPGKVFAFEPLPTNVSFLRRHLALNAIRNVEVLEMALSDETGTAKFQAEQTRAMGRLDARGNLCVKMSSLDAILQSGEISPPDCIKMDIEGAEFRALIGAKLCFEKYKPKLLLATHGKEVHENCCQLLRSWNYEVRVVEMQSPDRGEVVATPTPSSLIVT